MDKIRSQCVVDLQGVSAGAHDLGCDLSCYRIVKWVKTLGSPNAYFVEESAERSSCNGLGLGFLP